jgi:hypothetical protein
VVGIISMGESYSLILQYYFVKYFMSLGESANLFQKVCFKGPFLVLLSFSVYDIYDTIL